MIGQVLFYVASGAVHTVSSYTLYAAKPPNQQSIMEEDPDLELCNERAIAGLQSVINQHLRFVELSLIPVSLAVDSCAGARNPASIHMGHITVGGKLTAWIVSLLTTIITERPVP